ncbi:phosphatidic acid phosphatase type 2/haloperoxidase [Hyaloraphidium curvatum]|nr:phosphatidic acid phosphatase type 2/haloperoxidase [Hyaloraphidium curvatum]
MGRALRTLWLLLAVASGALLFAGPAQGSAASDWNALALQYIRLTGTSPPRASRALAILHLAIFDAVNGAQPRYAPYLTPRSPAAFGAGPKAAAAAAAQAVLNALWPQLAVETNSTFASKLLESEEPPEALDAGVRWGKRVAAALLAARQDDGSDRVVAYDALPGPYVWVPTLPAFAPALLPQWGGVRPFAVPAIPGGGDEDADGEEDGPPFAVRAPPPPLGSARYAREFYELASIGRIDSTVRTEDQTFIAKFWAQAAGTSTPPGMWNSIAARCIKDEIAQGISWPLVKQARLFAVLTAAQADGAISCWWTKYLHNGWRPITAIRLADNSTNRRLPAPDPNWLPLIPTPPFPGYTSGHSTFSGASAAVLAQVFGKDEFTFTASTEFPGVPDRTFPSFTSAAAEAGLSRIYGGIHFPADNLPAQRIGARIGRYSARNLARPIRLPCPAFAYGGSAEGRWTGIPVFDSPACEQPLNQGGAEIRLRATGARPPGSCTSRGRVQYYDTGEGRWATAPADGGVDFYASGSDLRRRCVAPSPARAGFAASLHGVPLRLRISCGEEGFVYFFWSPSAGAAGVEGVPRVECDDDRALWN